jgi:hypothetical protein
VGLWFVSIALMRRKIKMMIADIIIEFTYFILRILYNIVKYLTIAVISLVKYLYRQHVKRSYRKQVKKGNFTISKDKNGKYLLTIGGSESE